MYKSKYIRIIDKIVLGQEKFLSIIEIGNKYYLLSITGNSIKIIKELEKEDLIEATQNDANQLNGFDFKKILESFNSKKKN